MFYILVLVVVQHLLFSDRASASGLRYITQVPCSCSCSFDRRAIVSRHQHNRCVPYRPRKGALAMRLHWHRSKQYEIKASDLSQLSPTDQINENPVLGAKLPCPMHSFTSHEIPIKFRKVLTTCQCDREVSWLFNSHQRYGKLARPPVSPIAIHLAGHTKLGS